MAAAAEDASFLFLWRQWDGGWFLEIAMRGYRGEPQAAAFYPLYPALLRAGGELLGGRLVLAGLLLSLPLTWVALACVYALARERLGARPALLATAYLALFPTAFYLHALYSEALFLALAAAAFLTAERRRYLGAGLLTGAAMLTRPLGFALLAGVSLLALRQRPGRRALARLAAAPLAFAAYPALLAASGRGPLDFLRAESHWRDTSLRGALGGPYLAVREAWEGATELASGYDFVALLNVTAFLALVGLGLLALRAWRLLGAPYGVYCLIALAMPLLAPADPWPLVSIQRFALALFPCFIALGALPLRRLAHAGLLSVSGAGMAYLLVYWARGEFVA